MQKNISVAELCSFFWELERKYNLFDWKIMDVYIWPVIRLGVYYELTEKTGIFSSVDQSKHYSMAKRTVKALKEIYGFIFKNPFFSVKRYDNILLPHPRKINGKDIYSYTPPDKITGGLLTINQVDSAVKDSKTIDIYRTFSRILSRLTDKNLNFSDTDLQFMKNIEDEIMFRFNTTICLKNRIAKALITFKHMYKVYRCLFLKNKIKTIYIVVGYCNMEAIAAGRDLGIKIVELQHGIITKYHLGYSYPGHPAVPYSPDKIMCFGRFWAENTDFAAGVQTEIYGAPFIHELGSKFSRKKEKNSILFVSQGVIGIKLFWFALETAKLLPHYKINFNLHPGESPANYRKLLISSGNIPNNFSISYKKPHIFELLGKTEYQAGVFSTTLFEGIALHTKIIVIKMEGAEYMEPIINKGDAVAVKTPKEFADKFKFAPNVDNIDYYYTMDKKNLKI